MATDSAIPFAELSTRSSLHSSFHLPMNKIIWTAQLPGQDLKTSYLFVSLKVLDCKIIAWLTSHFGLVLLLFSFSENDRIWLPRPTSALFRKQPWIDFLWRRKRILHCRNIRRTAAFVAHSWSIYNLQPAFTVLTKCLNAAASLLKPSSMKFGNEEQFAKTANRIGLY